MYRHPHYRYTDTRALQAPIAPLQIPTRTRPRSQTSLSAVEYRTTLLSASTVSTYISGQRITRNCILTETDRKLKERLEDLERRAASSSASPEQKPAELQPTQRSPHQPFPSPSPLKSDLSRRIPEVQGHYVAPHEERDMFQKQHIDRQLSTSPHLSATLRIQLQIQLHVRCQK